MTSEPALDTNVVDYIARFIGWDKPPAGQATIKDLERALLRWKAEQEPAKDSKTLKAIRTILAVADHES